MALSQKAFLTYEQQIEHLKAKNFIIQDDNYAEKALEEISYFGLICGYKDIFKDQKNYDFISDTTFIDIYNLYLFDADLRELH